MGNMAAKLEMVLGIGILLFFGLMTVMALGDKELASDGFLPFCIVCDGMGVILIILSIRRHRLLHAFRAYVAVLSNDPTGSIANLAVTMGTTEALVRTNIDRMIRKRYFTDAYIDLKENCIVFQGRETVPMERPDTVIINCPSCGGLNAVPRGQVAECKYCGSPLKG